MAQDGENKEETLDPSTGEGQASGYISFGQARVLAIQHVRDNTGFDLAIEAQAPTTEPPRAEELAALREFDPERLYIA